MLTNKTNGGLHDKKFGELKHGDRFIYWSELFIKLTRFKGPHGHNVSAVCVEDSGVDDGVQEFNPGFQIIDFEDDTVVHVVRNTETLVKD